MVIVLKGCRTSLRRFVEPLRGESGAGQWRPRAGKCQSNGRFQDERQGYFCALRQGQPPHADDGRDGRHGRRRRCPMCCARRPSRRWSPRSARCPTPITPCGSRAPKPMPAAVGLEHVTLVSEGNSEKGIADIKAMLAKTGGNMVLNSDPNDTPDARPIVEACKPGRRLCRDAVEQADGSASEGLQPELRLAYRVRRHRQRQADRRDPVQGDRRHRAASWRSAA